MRLLREHTIIRCLWVLTALQVLNISIDLPDPVHRYPGAKTDMNDIESLAEWFLEDGLKMEGAIPEHEDPGNDEERCISPDKGHLFHQYSRLSSCFSGDDRNISGLFSYLFSSCSSVCRDIPHPPPEG